MREVGGGERFAGLKRAAHGGLSGPGLPSSVDTFCQPTIRSVRAGHGGQPQNCGLQAKGALALPSGGLHSWYGPSSPVVSIRARR